MASSNSFVDGSLHTSETVSFVIQYSGADNYADTGATACDAYYTVPAGTFDERYHTWRLSLDTVSMMHAANNALDPNHTFSMMFSPIRKAVPHLGFTAGGWRSNEQTVLVASHWGVQAGGQNVESPLFQTTNVLVENLNNKTIRLRCINPTNGAAPDATLDPATVWDLVGGGVNHVYTLTFSATPILHPL